MKHLISTLSFHLFITISAYSQCTYSDKYCISSDTVEGYPFKLYSFSREGSTIKAKFFAHNAYSQYETWITGKNILLVTEGPFTDKPTNDPTRRPVGLCVDNGQVVTRTPDMTMDGMVIVYDGGPQNGGMAIVDMDVNPVRTPIGNFYPRTSAVDRFNFLTWGESNHLTLFQTQLLYSNDRPEKDNFINLYYGPKRERRFLAICRKGGNTHHVVIDATDPLELNLSAKHAKTVLERKGFSVLYILNFETGSGNLLHTQVNGALVDQLPRRPNGLHSASNLLVYYID